MTILAKYKVLIFKDVYNKNKTVNYVFLLIIECDTNISAIYKTFHFKRGG